MKRYPLPKADLLELAALIQEALDRQAACKTYDQTYLDYLNAHTALEAAIKAAYAKITTEPKLNFTDEEVNR